MKYNYWVSLGSKSGVVALLGAFMLWGLLLLTNQLGTFKSMPIATGIVGAAVFSGIIIAILEIIDATGVKDYAGSHIYSMGSSLIGTLVTICVIWILGFMLFNYMGASIPFVARAGWCCIMATYVALPNTGDDLWLFGMWVFCVAISLLTGWLTISEWIQYQGAIFTAGVNALPQLPGIFSGLI